MSDYDFKVKNRLNVDIDVSCRHGQGTGGKVGSGNSADFKFSSNDDKVTAAFTPKRGVRPQDAIGCKSAHDFFIKKTAKEWEVKITGTGAVKRGEPTNVEVGTPQ